jgi:hypothetical protein
MFRPVETAKLGQVVCKRRHVAKNLLDVFGPFDLLRNVVGNKLELLGQQFGEVT